ncbi:uroporphyrinogen-III synthase [Chryseobacterium arthrosphaerae]|uniref:uroporphyrinogen-III synthase n=1 Tax=Chryseobacterium arthrosphaerae TaxID=651561 RepID=UPI000F4DB2D9|nr:uroporphyrinogen-III synthase [Chryseobacterium arthrosphaerae]AYZ14580.1 uroporphyrinogen-III synthase [Chryseobacterium arthrosphaerae]
MKILFTKNIDHNIISKELGEDTGVDCIEVIKTKPIMIGPFELKNYSLIFTSVNGVTSFFKNRFKPNEDFTAKNYNKIYCVGEKTKRALRKHGFGTFKVLKNAETLSRFIIGNCQHEQFLHFCGNLAINVLDKDLPLQNISYKKITIYNTEEINPLIPEKYHAAVFFSPSGVRSFARRNSLNGMKLFSIGETTSGELRNYTQEKIFTSEENTLTSIFELIRKEFGNRI